MILTKPERTRIMQDLVKLMAAEIKELELRLNKLKKAHALLGAYETREITGRRKAERKHKSGVKTYRDYILEILAEFPNKKLTTQEITQELAQMGVSPMSLKPDTVIAACLRTMAKAGFITRDGSRRGIVHFIPSVEPVEIAEKMDIPLISDTVPPPTVRAVAEPLGE
jgi:hypothetical protein